MPYSPLEGIDSCSVKRPWRRGPARADSAADAASRREDDATCPHSPLPRPSTARSAARSSSPSGTSATTCACFTTSAAPRASAPRSRFAAPPAGRPSRAAATCLLTCASAATVTPRSRLRCGLWVRSAYAVGLGIAAADRPSSRAKIGRSPASRRRGAELSVLAIVSLARQCLPWCCFDSAFRRPKRRKRPDGPFVAFVSSACCDWTLASAGKRPGSRWGYSVSGASAPELDLSNSSCCPRPPPGRARR